MANAKTRKCPKCGQNDTTDFSTCRYCGTSYTFKKQHDAGTGWAGFFKGPAIAAIIFCLAGSIFMRDSFCQLGQWMANNLFVDSNQQFKEADAILSKDPIRIMTRSLSAVRPVPLSFRTSKPLRT